MYFVVLKRGGPKSLVRLAYLQTNRLSFTNRKRKYVEEKMTATLKFKQSSIATVRNHLLTVYQIPDPPYFSLPTTFKLTIPGFPKNLLPVSCGDIWLLKKSEVKCRPGIEASKCLYCL
jgi:hypothetical protein